MLIELTINQLLMGLFENSFAYMIPRLSFIRKISLFYTSQRARIEWASPFTYLSQSEFLLVLY